MHLDIDFVFKFFVYIFACLNILHSCVLYNLCYSVFFIVFDFFLFFWFVARSVGHLSVIVIQLTVDFFPFYLYNIVALLLYTHDD